MKRYIIGSLALLFSTLCLASSGYDYPIDNALAATVIGTPKDYVAVLPNKIRRSEKKVIVFPDREVKKFIPRRALNYTLVRQKHAAPLVFSIAGTGASHRSAKMLLLEKAFFQAGFHVVSLPSPTYANFIVTASTTQVPGHIVQDSADLYRVMELVHEQIRDRVKVSEFYVTGYSLGGAQAAFVARLDEERKAFNFKKVLMINPPVSLFNSVSILDRMLEENIPGGPNNFNAFFDDLMNEFTEVYKR
jgi:predicted alpha/beta-fold hydrolase